MHLNEKIIGKKSGIFLYGLTPPKLKTEEEKIKIISQKQMNRIRGLMPDGLILYDIHDEKDRNSEARPFPFLETLDPQLYSEQYLGALALPRIIYRCVGKYNHEKLKSWIEDDNKRDFQTVFVGAASRSQEVSLSLKEAYDLYNACNHKMTLGGVCIPERHALKDNEHLRMVRKQKSGCNFFVSQAVFNLEHAKNFLSDYYYYCEENHIDMVPIILTLSPCGSKKTLEFLKWLGIHVSKWLENDILSSQDPSLKSVQILEDIFSDLWAFSKEKGIPLGCNIESISVSKKEIEASVLLGEKIKSIID
jgi:hypothetical protein